MLLGCAYHYDVASLAHLPQMVNYLMDALTTRVVQALAHLHVSHGASFKGDTTMAEVLAFTYVFLYMFVHFGNVRYVVLTRAPRGVKQLSPQSLALMLLGCCIRRLGIAYEAWGRRQKLGPP